MKTKSASSDVHRFQAATPLIDQPLEERKVILCQMQIDGQPRRPRADRSCPGRWQVGKTPFRNTPDPQAPNPQDDVVRIPTAPSPRFDLDPDVFKETLIKGRGG